MLTPRHIADRAIAFMCHEYNLAELSDWLSLSAWQTLPCGCILATVAVGTMLQQRLLLDQHGHIQPYRLTSNG